MTELAYLFCREYDGSGDLVRQFERWLIARLTPADVMRIEVQAFRDTLDVLAVSGP